MIRKVFKSIFYLLIISNPKCYDFLHFLRKPPEIRATHIDKKKLRIYLYVIMQAPKQSIACAQKRDVRKETPCEYMLTKFPWFNGPTLIH